MAFPVAIGDVAKVSIIYKGATGEEAVNTFYYVVSTVGGTPATDHDIAQAFDGANAGTIQSCLPTDCKYDGVEVSLITYIPPFVTQKSGTGAGFGVWASISMGQQVSGIISWLTRLAGPKFRGRIFFPFPGISAILAGIPTAAYLAALGAVATAIFGFTAVSVGGRTCGLLPVLWHRRTRTFDYISTANLPDKFATQKRRGNYGKNTQPPI